MATRILAIVAVIIAFAGATVLLVRSPAVRIPYHEWRMQAGWDRHFRQTPTRTPGGLAGYDVGRAYLAYEHHRDRLVELGAIVRREYAFDHLTTPSHSSRDLLNWIRQSGPPAIDWTSSWPASGTPPTPLELTVWIRPQDVASWDAVIAERDVPDYADRFMTPEPD